PTPHLPLPSFKCTTFCARHAKPRTSSLPHTFGPASFSISSSSSYLLLLLLRGKMARTAFVALAVGMIGAANALKVVTPSEGLTVIADRTYTVEWEGTSENNRFEIDLYYCGSYCMEDECGEWVTALCPYGESGCPDNEGDYDIVMPEPMSGTSGSGYKVRVMDVDDEEDADCSDDFYLIGSEEAPKVGDSDGPTIKVTSPAEGDMAEACHEYTIEFDYDNGVGSSVDRFSIDLYKAEGSGDCGTYVTSICDKPSIGCKDSVGDYDVEIPCDTESGEYKVRVGRFEDDSLYACSGAFEIVSKGGDGDSSSDSESKDGDLDSESQDRDSDSSEDMSMSYTF
ncbi:unnamed protein product, partial [Laminaria digitata]